MAGLRRPRHRGRLPRHEHASQSTGSAATYSGLADLLRVLDESAFDELPRPQRLAIDRVLAPSADSDPAAGQRAVVAAVRGVLDRLAQMSPILSWPSTICSGSIRRAGWSSRRWRGGAPDGSGSWPPCAPTSRVSMRWPSSSSTIPHGCTGSTSGRSASGRCVRCWPAGSPARWPAARWCESTGSPAETPSMQWNSPVRPTAARLSCPPRSPTSSVPASPASPTRRSGYCSPRPACLPPPWRSWPR